MGEHAREHGVQSGIVSCARVEWNRVADRARRAAVATQGRAFQLRISEIGGLGWVCTVATTHPLAVR